MTPYYDEDGITIYHGDCREFYSSSFCERCDGHGWVTDDTLRTDRSEDACRACTGSGFVDPALAADVLVTDPPYGITYESGWDNALVGIAGDTDTTLRDVTMEWWGNRPAAVFGTWRRPRPNGVRGVLVWDKGLAAGMGDLSFPWKPNWEEIYIMGDGWRGSRDSSVLRAETIVTWNGRAGQRVHPHQKPVGLLVQILNKAPGGVIVDPFMGSGTTLRAARNLGRKAIGIEIEERYCEIAVARLAQGVLAL